MIIIGATNPQDVRQNTSDIQDLEEGTKTILTYNFEYDSHIIEAESGDFDAHNDNSETDTNWTRNSETLDVTTYSSVAAYELFNSPTKNISLEKPLSLEDWQNLQDFGGIFKGRIALGKDDGNQGIFTALETHQGTQIKDSNGDSVFTGDYRRLGGFFNHNGVHAGTADFGSFPELTFDGVSQVTVVDYKGETVVNTLPEIVPGEFFNYEVHLRDGLDTSQGTGIITWLYINNILIYNPKFVVRSTVGSGLVIQTGSSNSTNRHAYFRWFGSTINKSLNVKIFSKEELEANDGVSLIIPKGTRNYSIILPKSLNLPVGYFYEIISQATGEISWTPTIVNDVCSDTQYTDQATCEANGTCSDTQYTDQTACTNNGETWTSKTPGTWTFETWSVIGLAGTIDGFAEGKTELIGLKEINRVNVLKNGAQFVATEDELTAFESLRTGMISYGGMSLTTNIWTPDSCSDTQYTDQPTCEGNGETWTSEFCSNPAYPNQGTCEANTVILTVKFAERTMRFVDKIRGSAIIVTRPAVDFEFTNGVDAPDDLGVVHFYEKVSGVIFGSAKTDWSTPEQRRKYVYLGNADVNLAKNDFVQANNPLVSAFGLLDSFGDYLAIGGSIKSSGGKVSANATEPLELDITGYTAVAWGRNFDDEKMPHTPTSSDVVGAELHLGYKTSDIAMLFGSAQSDIDPTQYQRIEHTTLSTVPTGKYTIQRVYQYPGTTYNMVIYGNTLYDNLEQAVLNASIERYNLHPSIVPSCFLTYIVVRNDVTDLQVALNNGTAAILNYDGRTHPSTIGAEASPALSLKAGGELRSMVDQFVNNDGTDSVATLINFEIGHSTLYGCEWNGTDGSCSDTQYATQTLCLTNNEIWTDYKTLKNISQKDMVVNIVPQIGRRETQLPVDLEIFIDISYDDGNTWNADISESYATLQSLDNQINSLTASVLIFRVVPNAMIRVGMITDVKAEEIGMVSIGKGSAQPATSISGRHVPSCILTIT